MDFAAGAVPIEVDGPFVRALPEDIRPLVAQFHPTGTIRGTAHLSRTPLARPPRRAGRRAGRCQAVPQRRLRRHLGRPAVPRAAPDWPAGGPPRTTASSPTCSGENGLARIEASGRAEVVGPGKFAADVTLSATGLRFDSQLLNALPREWQATWHLLNPTGSTRVEAHVVAGYEDPARPDRTWLRLTVGRSGRRAGEAGAHARARHAGTGAGREDRAAVDAGRPWHVRLRQRPGDDERRRFQLPRGPGPLPNRAGPALRHGAVRPGRRGPGGASAATRRRASADHASR